MSAHALLKVGEKDQDACRASSRCLPSILSVFPNNLNKSNNTEHERKTLHLSYDLNRLL